MLARYDEKVLALLSSRPMGTLSLPATINSWEGSLRTFSRGVAITFTNIKYFHMHHTEIDFTATITQGGLTWQLESICRSSTPSHFVLADGGPFSLTIMPRFNATIYVVIG